MSLANSPSRRQFLRTSVALSTVGLASCLDHIGLGSAYAQTADYRALVCVFLFGGNDGNNMIVPTDARYADYVRARAVNSTGAPGIGLATSELRALSNTAGQPSGYGFHPSFSELANLFGLGKVAVLANVGPLLEPMTRAQYLARSRRRPESLFSHSDQQAQWQSSTSTGDILTGWGGRIADRMGAANAGSTVPMTLSFAGSHMFANGAQSSPLALPQSGGFSLAGINANPTSRNAMERARLDALNAMLVAERSNRLMLAAGATAKGALDNSVLLDPITRPDTQSYASFFRNAQGNLPGGGLTRQLFQVAKIIEARAALGHTRDIFFVSQGGYDTHNNQLTSQASLLREVSTALNAFYLATVQLGVAQQVTAFTLSDFGRTFKPASGTPPGSDHAWGNHQLVVGGAVDGGKVHGTFPSLALAGADDATSEGRWIPTTSIEQYGDALAAWFGVNATDRGIVFPNRGRFGASPALFG
jgi:uncharacterized protein (DUF1501 family)